MNCQRYGCISVMEIKLAAAAALIRPWPRKKEGAMFIWVVLSRSYTCNGSGRVVRTISYYTIYFNNWKSPPR